MSKGNYKVLWTGQGRRGGIVKENYTGKTHSLAGAKKVVEKYNMMKKKSPKFFQGESIRIVKVRKQKSQSGFFGMGRMRF
jgi:hypothetical protein